MRERETVCVREGKKNRERREREREKGGEHKVKRRRKPIDTKIGLI